MVYNINQKMKSVLSTWFCLSICIFFTMSCKENNTDVEQSNNPKPFSEYIGKPVTLDLKGKVMDNNQTPLDSVLIVVGNTSSLTDELGNFTIENAPANEDFVSLEAQRKDYKNMVLNLIPKKDTDSINIILHKETEPCLFWFCKHNHNLPKTVN